MNEGATDSVARPSGWHRPMWWLNILAVIILLFTYLAPHLSPEVLWIPALFAIAYPYQLVLHIAFMGWWLVFRRKRVLLSLMAILLGWGHIADHFQVLGRSSAPDAVNGTSVKLMSYNVRLFDLYNWSGNTRTHDSIFALLHRVDADILCLQEFFHSSDRRYFRTKDALLKDFRYRYLHDSYSQRARFDQHFGIATFSTHPIIARGDVDFPDDPNNQCIWSDIVIGRDTIRVYNAHLASYHFGDADYKFIEGLDTGTRSDSIRSGGARILKRLRRGFILRADEVQRIAAHMRESPHPVVYCGDMNDVPMSYSYTTLRNGLDDAFTESGSGTGGTYIGALPNLRIDHILIAPRLRAWDFVTHSEEFSDHRAVSCMIGPVAGE
ncbi:MAG: endonuclease/exonuclease/phosphatase family protein [Flavobacteriales bacterium]